MGVAPVKYSDFISRDSIITDLASNTKAEVIREMVETLAKTGGVPEAEVENIISAVMRREELGTTGIGQGVAVPHTKALCVERLVGMVALSKTGVEFDSLDQEKVQLLFLLVSPPDRPGEHLRALEHVTRNLRNSDFLNRLKNADSADDLWNLLNEADN